MSGMTRRNAAPGFTARGARGTNVARHAITPNASRTNAVGNATNRLRDRRAAGNAGNQPHDRNNRNAVGTNRNTAGAFERGRATNGSAANPATRRGAGTNNRILRNAALTNLGARSPQSRNLANSTFRGRFARSSFAGGWDRGHHHRHFGFVLGFVGPLFWPYAYDDFVDYTFWGDAYDTFWPYAYDDVFEGLYGAYAPQYGANYAYAGAPASGTAYQNGSTPHGRHRRRSAPTRRRA